MSQLGWIDFSSNERNKAKLILAALNEPGTLDELGIGQIRDAFANLLFPGLSTIQTRAKYFVVLARLFRNIQEGKVPSGKSVERWMEEQENAIAKLLVTNHGNNESGIIGSESIDQGGVSRRPSSIYWNGLKTFDIVHTTLSLNEFFHYLLKHPITTHHRSLELEEGLDDADAFTVQQLVCLPNGDAKAQSAQDLSLYLSKEEAEFLAEKLSTTPNVDHSVLAQILLQGGLAELIDNAQSQRADQTSISFDALCQLLVSNSNVSNICKVRAHQANTFSIAMEGAFIRYNIRLADKNKFSSVASLQQAFIEWKSEVDQRKLFQEHCVEDWLAAIGSSRIHPKSIAFVRGWCERMQNGASEEELDDFVVMRAKENKKDRCLLNKRLSKDQWVGMRRLDFRWGVASNILADIERGLYAGR